MAYEGKILQLKEIISTGNKYFLKLELDYKGYTQILWEIDNFTGNLLENLIDFDDKYRYRLSFYTPYTPGNEKKLCFVTRTFREESKPIYFLASDSFIRGLMAIKETSDLEDLDKKVFTLWPSKEFMENIEAGKDPHDTRFFKKPIHKFGLVSIPAFSLVFFLVLGYLGGYFQRDIKMGDKVSAAEIDSKPAIEVPKDEPVTNIDEDREENLQEETPEFVESINREYFELESTVNFRLPEGKVAITFDDGPSKFTEEIVDILMEYNIPASFFFVGRLIPHFSEEVKYAASNGYAIGSHSVSHAQLTKVSVAKMEEEIKNSMNSIEEVTGNKPLLFRPPYGSYNKGTENFIAKNDYKIVLWNIDTRDWEVRNEDKIMENIKNKEASGSIILLHEIEPTVKALPHIIEYLQSLDLEIVNLK